MAAILSVAVMPVTVSAANFLIGKTEAYADYNQSGGAGPSITDGTIGMTAAETPGGMFSASGSTAAGFVSGKGVRVYSATDDDLNSSVSFGSTGNIINWRAVRVFATESFSIESLTVKATLPNLTLLVSIAGVKINSASETNFSQPSQTRTWNFDPPKLINMGDEIRVEGSGTNCAIYEISAVGVGGMPPGGLTAPDASIGSGNVVRGQRISLTGTYGANIYYIIDPPNSYNIITDPSGLAVLYTEPVVIKKNTKIIAVCERDTDYSAVAEFNYTATIPDHEYCFTGINGSTDISHIAVNTEAGGTIAIDTGEDSIAVTSASAAQAIATTALPNIYYGYTVAKFKIKPSNVTDAQSLVLLLGDGNNYSAAVSFLNGKAYAGNTNGSAVDTFSYNPADDRYYNVLIMYDGYIKRYSAYADLTAAGKYEFIGSGGIAGTPHIVSYRARVVGAAGTVKYKDVSITQPVRIAISDVSLDVTGGDVTYGGKLLNLGSDNSIYVGVFIAIYNKADGKLIDVSMPASTINPLYNNLEHYPVSVSADLKENAEDDVDIKAFIWEAGKLLPIEISTMFPTRVQ